MANINLVINNDTRQVSKNRSFAGVCLENLQDAFVITFSGTFIDGNAVMEYEVNGNFYSTPMTKENESYVLDITQTLISEQGSYPFQVRIQSGDAIFKSQIFYLKVYPSLNAIDGEPTIYNWKDWVIDYVDENGGKINVIRKNDVELPIVEKEVNIEVPTRTSELQNNSGFVNGTDLQNALSTKQDILESGINIKTINNESILGSGNLTIQSGSGTQLYKHNITLMAEEGGQPLEVHLLFINNDDTLINTQSLFEHAFSYDKVKLDIIFIVDDFVPIICMDYNEDGTAKSFVGFNSGLPMTDITSMVQSYSDTITQL